ncbi:uncharacterized protein SCHCODRAFT_02690112 [Schizophyllum commune H4-8]|nr:uncharacterized protein SCHCODRAFT_02690112 [Schizophyllum commune H4-8]KAI5890100.1 hypothetical protein SCHCODRAFT_02690112 [Schizophyllum commune H4-8]
MVYISQVEHLFPFIEPAHQITDRIFMLQDGLPRVADQIAAATTDTPVRLAAINALNATRDCATNVGHAMDALSKFTRAISKSFMDVDGELDPHVREIGVLYEAFLDCLENVLDSADQSNNAWSKSEDIVIHTLSYPPVVDYVFVHHLFPFIIRHNLVDLSSRAVMLTSGRTTLANARLNVLDIADLARHLKTYAADSRANFRLEVLAGIRAQTVDSRSLLASALDAVYNELRGAVHAMESSAQRFGWMADDMTYLASLTLVHARSGSIFEKPNVSIAA